MDTIQQFLAVFLRIAVALEKLATVPVPTPPSDTPSGIPAPPPMPATTEKVIFKEDFSTVQDIPDPTTVPAGTAYHWGAGNTDKAKTTIEKIGGGFFAAIIAVFGVLREAQQGARAFYVNNGLWDALNAYFRKAVRLQIDFYLAEDWKAGDGQGYFTTLPIEVKRRSDESATVQTNIDENGKFWLGMPFGAQKMFFNAAMPKVHKGWNHLEVRMLLAPENTAWAELEYEGVVIHGVGAVSNLNGGTAIALTNYSNAVDELSVPMTNVLLTEIAA